MEETKEEKGIDITEGKKMFAENDKNEVKNKIHKTEINKIKQQHKHTNLCNTQTPPFATHTNTYSTNTHTNTNTHPLRPQQHINNT